ncbi:carboxypeptidase regulatory-like domain-containing protein [Candidatus Riflebacteria bacterium]
MGKKLNIFLSTTLFGIILTLWFNGCGQKVVPEEPEVEIFSSITGIVRDSINGEPISGVTITLDDKKYITDTNGRYSISNLKRGGYTLKYTVDGYEETSADFSLAHGSQSLGNIELKRLPIIENITVTNIGPTSADISFQTYRSFSSQPATIFSSASSSSQNATTLTMLANAFVRYAMDSNNLNQISSTSQSSINHTITISGLETGKTYYIKVEASDPTNSDNKNTSEIHSFTTNDGISPQIGPVQVKTYTDSAEIKWGSSKAGTGKIYYGASESEVQAKSTSIGTDTTVLTELSTDHYIYIPGLQPKTKYYYQVESKDSAGNYEEQEIQNFTTDELLAPTLYSPLNVTNSSVLLIWDLNSDPSLDNTHFEKYQISVYTSDPSNSSSVSAVATNEISKKESTEYTVRNLSANTQYYFKICIYDKGGNKGCSDVVETTTSSDGLYFDETTTNSPLSEEITGAFVRKATLADGSDAKGWIVTRRGQSARLSNSGSSSSSVTWTVVNTPANYDLHAVDGSSSHAAACGKVGTLLYSQDNKNWASLGAGTSNNLNDIHLNTSTDAFWFCGDADETKGTVGVLSFPGGQPEILVSAAGFFPASYSKPIWNGISAVDNILITVGNNGLIASYSIAGALASESFATASATGIVLIEDNNALGSLNSQASQTNHLRDVDMIDANTGWIVGDRGVILHLKSGSNKWFGDPIEIGLKENILEVDAVTATLAYAVTDQGKILKYDSNSGVWVIVNSFSGNKLRTIKFDPDISKQFGVAAGDSIYTIFSLH